MANVTFSSSKMKKDVTIHAIAGDCNTLLGIAREHVIPLDCECEKGECNFCAVQVAASTSDSPPPWRLACQFVVRDVDILVSF